MTICTQYIRNTLQQLTNFQNHTFLNIILSSKSYFPQNPEECAEPAKEEIYLTANFDALPGKNLFLNPKIDMVETTSEVNDVWSKFFFVFPSPST